MNAKYQTDKEQPRGGLAQYIPQCIVRQIGDATQAVGEPSDQRFEGAVLFTDIAGFSRITDWYSAKGPEGTEQLSSVLDAYFGRMTEIALDHGGDVVDFVGDAIVVVWRSQGMLADAVTMAVQSGIAMQDAMREVAEATDLSLQQRISVSAGDLSLFTIGGYGGKWHWLIAGDPMRHAGASYHDARPGEVLVCAPAWACVRDRCHGRELPSGHALADKVLEPATLFVTSLAALNAAVERRAEAFIADPHLYRFCAGQWHRMGEFRNITTVFIGFPDLDVSGCDMLAQLQRACECVQCELASLGGSFERLSMDDKGVTVLAAFGLRASTHEDDVYRAMRVAESIVGRLREQQTDCSVGITTGRAFYGESGGPRRRHVGLVGTTVNLAARLMQAAAGGILCDEATRQRGECRQTFEVRPALSVKGQGEPVPVYVPAERVSREAVQQRESKSNELIVGRATERQHLSKRLDALLRGIGGFVVVRGEAGIGKSRLLADAAQLAQTRGIKTVVSYSSFIESSTPYYAWRQVLIWLLADNHPFDKTRALEGLQRRCAGDERMRSWIPLLSDVIPLDCTENETTRHITGDARASSVQALLTYLLREETAQQRTLLVFDDLYWFDHSSADALAAVLEGAPRLLVFAGARSPVMSTAGTVQELLRKAEGDTLVLDALGREAIDLLACQKLGAREVPPELGDFVYARTGGHPLYSEQLFLALRDAELVSVLDDTCRLNKEFNSSSSPIIPDSLHGVIVSRVDALGQLEQQTLRLASIIGRAFSPGMLCDLQPGTADANMTDHALDTLCQADLLVRRASGLREDYSFKHAILKDVVYELIPFAQRRAVHRAVAEWIERNEVANLEPFSSELALHWERAADIPKALDYLEKAAVLAINYFANREAIGCIDKGFELLRADRSRLDSVRLAKWEQILGDAHYELLEHAAAARHFKRCVTHLGHSVPESIFGVGAALLKQLVLQLIIRLWPAASYKELTPEKFSVLKSAAHIHYRLGEIAFYANRPVSLLYHALASVNIAEPARATSDVAVGFSVLSMAFWIAGLRRLSRFYADHSLVVAGHETLSPDIAFAVAVNGVYWAGQGTWSVVDERVERASTVFRQIGDIEDWHRVRGLAYHVLVMRGMFAQAEEVLREAKAAIPKDMPTMMRSWVCCSEMGIALARGKPPVVLIERLSEVQTPELPQADRLRCLGIMAIARTRLGDDDKALAAADEALAILARNPPTAWHLTDGLAGVAEAYLDACESAGSAHDRDALLRKARTACETLRRYVSISPISGPRSEILYGRFELLRGRPNRARKCWELAIKDSGHLEMRYEKGLALYEYARSLGDANPRRAEYLEQAGSLFRDLGARHNLALTRRLIMKSSVPC